MYTNTAIYQASKKIVHQSPGHVPWPTAVEGDHDTVQYGAGLTKDKNKQQKYNSISKYNVYTCNINDKAITVGGEVGLCPPFVAIVIDRGNLGEGLEFILRGAPPHTICLKSSRAYTKLYTFSIAYLSHLYLIIPLEHEIASFT